MNGKLKKLIHNQQESLKNDFLKHPNTFHNRNFHYDWWVFPQQVPKHRRNSVTDTSKTYSLTDAETKALLQDKTFFPSYLRMINLYLHNLKTQGWNHYDVRFAKLLQSLHQFIKVASLSKANTGKCNQLKVLRNNAIKYANQHIQKRSPFLEESLQLSNNSKTIIPSTPAPKSTSLGYFNSIVIGALGVNAVLFALAPYSVSLTFLGGILLVGLGRAVQLSLSSSVPAPTTYINAQHSQQLMTQHKSLVYQSKHKRKIHSNVQSTTAKKRKKRLH